MFFKMNVFFVILAYSIIYLLFSLDLWNHWNCSDQNSFADCLRPKLTEMFFKMNLFSILLAYSVFYVLFRIDLWNYWSFSAQISLAHPLRPKQPEMLFKMNLSPLLIESPPTYIHITSARSLALIEHASLNLLCSLLVTKGSSSLLQSSGIIYSIWVMLETISCMFISARTLFSIIPWHLNVSLTACWHDMPPTTLNYSPLTVLPFTCPCREAFWLRPSIVAVVTRSLSGVLGGRRRVKRSDC